MSGQHTFEVMGQTITMPVEVRAARQAAATFLVDATAAQKIVGPSGLTVARKPTNKAICSLAIVDYEDNDLGKYKEIALAFIVEESPDVPAPASKAIATLIHRLPVSEQFTCEAGRGIWGFPKWVTDIDMHFHERDAHATLRQDGTDVLTINMKRGRLSVPKKPMKMVAYSFDSEGTLRRTPWETGGTGRQNIGLGGCTVEVGYGHPFADELRTLGFPRRAMMTIFDDALSAVFESPQIL